MNENLARSIKQRLLNLSKERGEELEYVLVRYACERFLYRLGRSEYGPDFVLKGATLFALWSDRPYRGTRDIDLLSTGASDAGSIRSMVEAVCNIECPEDAMSFDQTSINVSPVSEEFADNSMRVKLPVFLGKARIALQIDIGFGNHVSPVPEDATYPVLIELPPPRLKIYPKEAVISEKFAAMVQFGARNSRMKDFGDVFVMAREFDFLGSNVCAAIKSTFVQRALTQHGERPAMLNPAFFQDTVLSDRWRMFLAGGGFSRDIPGQFSEIGEAIMSFLGPAYESITAGQPFEKKWPAGGPWG